MLGGLARRVAFVEKARIEGNTFLVLDSGDLFFKAWTGPNSDKPLAKARVISRSYLKMNVSAVNIGTLDLLYGLDFLRKEASRGLPLISANLLDASQIAPLFRPFLIQEIAGVRIGFFGLLSAEIPPEFGPVLKKEFGEKILIKSPVEKAREIVAALRDKTDLIVLLSNLSAQEDREIAKAVPGIHFILGKYESFEIHEAPLENKTYIFRSFEKGMYIGRLQLVVKNPEDSFQDRTQIEKINSEIRTLEEDLQKLQKKKDNQNTYWIEPKMQRMEQRRDILRQELKELSRENSSNGNSLIWTLTPLETDFPEDPLVKEWIRQGGVEKD